MKDAFNVNDFLGILEQGVKINKRREDKEASVKSVSSKETAPSLEDLFEASEPLEVVENSVFETETSGGFKIIDVDDYEDDFGSHQNISDDEKRKKSDVEISKNGVFDELSKKGQNVKNGADAQFSSEEGACSEEDNSDFSADIEISKRTAEKSILKNPNSNLDVKNSSSPTLEPVFESVFDDVVSEVEPVKKVNLDSNISYSSDSVSQPLESSGVSVEQPIPLVSEYPVAISEEDLEPCVLYSADNESWDDAHTDFSFEEEPVNSVSSGDEDDFDVEYEGESELDEMDEVSSGVPQSASGITSVFDEDEDEDDEDVVETDIYDVDDFDDEEEDSDFDDYEDDDFDSESVESSDDIYDVEDFDDEDDFDEDDEDDISPEYDFSDGKPASEVYGNVEFEGETASQNVSVFDEEDDSFEDMETDFDDELEEDVEPVVSSKPVKSVSQEDEMDVEIHHSVKSKPAPVYKTFDDDDDDDFTKRALERAMGSRVQAKINVDESKKEEIVISDSFESVDEPAKEVVSQPEEVEKPVIKSIDKGISQSEQKPSASSKLEDSKEVSQSKEESKSLGIKDVSEKSAEADSEEPAVKFVKGMSLKDFLRENPKIRDEGEVLKYFSKADIVQAERRSQIMIRRGKIIL